MLSKGPERSLLRIDNGKETTKIAFLTLMSRNERKLATQILHLLQLFLISIRDVRHKEARISTTCNPGYTCFSMESETRVFQELIILWKLRGIRIPPVIMLIKSDASIRVTDLFLGVLYISCRL